MYKSKNHSKYNLKVHIVFVVKYRNKLINKDIDFFLKIKIQQIVNKSDFDIELMETDKDYIHLLIDYEPKVSIYKLLEGLSKKQLMNFEKHMSFILRSTFGGRKHFGVIDILHVL